MRPHPRGAQDGSKDRVGNGYPNNAETPVAPEPHQDERDGKELHLERPGRAKDREIVERGIRPEMPRLKGVGAAEGERAEAACEAHKERGIEPQDAPHRETDCRHQGAGMPLAKAFEKHGSAQHKEDNDRRLPAHHHEDELGQHIVEPVRVLDRRAPIRWLRVGSRSRIEWNTTTAIAA